MMDCDFSKKILINNKISVPKIELELIKRSSLEERLDNSIYAKLIYLSAPSGYGKTCFLSQYIKNIKQKVIWNTFYSEDNLTDTFVFNLVMSFKNIFEENIFEKLLRDNYNLKNIISSLLNLLEELNQEIFIFFDDFEVIKEPSILRLLFFFINNSNSRTHFIISGRKAFPACFSKLRNSFKVYEFNFYDLSFSSWEIKELFEKYNFKLSEKELTYILDKTEGFPLSLSMMLLSLKDNNNYKINIVVEHINNKYLTEFFFDQVFNNLDNKIKCFLLQTSLFYKFNTTFCNELLDINDAYLFIDEIAINNLFFINLDNNKTYFRYNNLFAEFLSNKLKNENSTLFKELCYKASKIARKYNLYIDSTEYAFNTNDYDFILFKLENTASLFIKNGEYFKLLKFIKKLPKEALLKNKKLSIYYSWCLSFTYNFTEAEEVIEHIKSKNVLTEEQIYLIDFSYIILYLRKGDNHSKLLLYSKLVLNHIHFFDLTLIGLVYFEVALAYASVWELSKSTELLNKAMIFSEENLFFIIPSKTQIARNFSLQGNLLESEKILKEIIKILEDNNFSDNKISIAVYKELARIYYNQNNIELLNFYIQKALSVLALIKEDLYGLSVYIALLFFNLKEPCCGNFEYYLSKTETIITKNKVPPALIELVKSLKISYFIELNKLDLLPNEWIENTKKSLNSILYKAKNIFIYDIGKVDSDSKILAKYYIEKNLLREANNIVQGLLELLESYDLKGAVISTLILKAIILKKQEKIQQAELILKKALALSEKQTYIRPFVEEEKNIKDLLINICKNLEKNNLKLKKSFEYLVLQAINKPIIKNIKNVSSVKKMINPLSSKEMEIIKLLALKLPNKDIAIKLNISLNTTKTHIKSIYKKLDLNSRKEAVQKAKEFNII